MACTEGCWCWAALPAKGCSIPGRSVGQQMHSSVFLFPAQHEFYHPLQWEHSEKKQHPCYGCRPGWNTKSPNIQKTTRADVQSKSWDTLRQLDSQTELKSLGFRSLKGGHSTSSRQLAAPLSPVPLTSILPLPHLIDYKSFSGSNHRSVASSRETKTASVVFIIPANFCHPSLSPPHL